MLYELTDRRKAIVEIQKQKELLVDSLIPVELKQKIKEINEEFSDKAESLSALVLQLENKIKDEVRALQVSVKERDLMVVYSQGRVSWDTKGLDGYAVAHPEINQFKKTGEPVITIRRIND